MMLLIPAFVLVSVVFLQCCKRKKSKPSSKSIAKIEDKKPEQSKAPANAPIYPSTAAPKTDAPTDEVLMTVLEDSYRVPSSLMSIKKPVPKQKQDVVNPSKAITENTKPNEASKEVDKTQNSEGKTKNGTETDYRSPTWLTWNDSKPSSGKNTKDIEMPKQPHPIKTERKKHAPTKKSIDISSFAEKEVAVQEKQPYHKSSSVSPVQETQESDLLSVNSSIHLQAKSPPATTAILQLKETSPRKPSILLTMKELAEREDLKSFEDDGEEEETTTTTESARVANSHKKTKATEGEEDDESKSEVENEISAPTQLSKSPEREGERVKSETATPKRIQDPDEADVTQEDGAMAEDVTPPSESKNTQQNKDN